LGSIKVEILLPKNYNDGREIEKDKFVDAYDEMENKFDGVTVYDVPLIGFWVDPVTKKHYDREKSIGCWVLCDENEKNIDNLKILKKDLESMFDQELILIYYIPINIIS
jgi:hypothetical protein